MAYMAVDEQFVAEAFRGTNKPSVRAKFQYQSATPAVLIFSRGARAGRMVLVGWAGGGGQRSRGNRAEPALECIFFSLSFVFFCLCLSFLWRI